MARLVVLAAPPPGPPPPPPPPAGSEPTLRWSFQAADLNGKPLGELRGLRGRKLRLPLNGKPTLDFTIDALNPLAGAVLLGDKTIVKAYENSTGVKVLRFQGPVTAREKVRGAEGGSISATASGLRWRLEHRLIGKSADGFSMGTVSALVDRGTIAAAILAEANASGDTGIRLGSVTPSSNTYVEKWRYKYADQALRELSAPLDGFDWAVDPIEPTHDGLGVALAHMRIGKQLGSVRPNAAWEFGTGKHNVDTWRDAGDSGGLANAAYNLPEGFPDNPLQGPISYEDAVSVGDRGRHELLVEYEDPSDDARDKLVKENVRVRKLPTQRISFDPIAEDYDADSSVRRVPRLFVDYDLGDTVPFRAVEYFEVRNTDGTLAGYTPQTTVNAYFRVFVVEVTITDEGVVKPALTLWDDGSEA